MRHLALVAYVFASIGAGAAVYADTKNTGAAYLAMAIWPMMAGYHLTKEAPPPPSKENQE